MIITASQLRQQAQSLDDEAFLLRTSGKRTQAARHNLAALAVRKAADEVAKIEPDLSERGLPLAYRRETPSQHLGLAIGFIAFVLTLIVGSAML